MFAQKFFLAALGLTCLIACACSYSIPAATTYEHVPDVIDSYPNPIADVAAAKASAAKISGVNWPAVHHYGYQIGKPLLVRDYGKLTNLYSALAPKRSFVGTIDAGFYRDHYGNIRYRDETSVGAIAV